MHVRHMDVPPRPAAGAAHSPASSIPAALCVPLRATCMFKLLVILLTSICATLAHARTAPTYGNAAAEVQRVSELMAARLQLMPQVAAWKLVQQLPIQDVQRE